MEESSIVATSENLSKLTGESTAEIMTKNKNDVFLFVIETNCDVDKVNVEKLRHLHLH